MRKLSATLQRAGAKLRPEKKVIFKAFRLTALDEVRVVIVGQDPYPNGKMATGLCFSAGEPPPVRRPYSLARILNRVSASIDCGKIDDRNLEPWAKEGVLLLNTVLTVEEGKAGSHRGLGWECFTNRAIQLIDEESNRPVVFMLWGEQAKRKVLLIDQRRHKVLEDAHPRSPSFSECAHFREANDFLMGTGQEPICWNIPSCPEGECAARPGVCRN
jgi:uracil-DNA glycosylase